MTKSAKTKSAPPRKPRVSKEKWAILGKAKRNVWLKIPVSEEMEAFLPYENDEGGYFGIEDVMRGLFNASFMETYGMAEQATEKHRGQSLTDFLKEAGYLRKDWTDPLAERNG